MGDRSDDWGPWTAARFPHREDRDRFLIAVASNINDEWRAKPALDDGLGAWVQWRVGRFLRLNDLAVAHRGRIIVTAVPRSER